MTGIVNHLWQSTAFTAAVALAAWTLRRNSPRVRYWLWLAASVKFLIPFSWIVFTGSRVQLPPDAPALHAVTVNRISSAFAPVPVGLASVPMKTTFTWRLVLGPIWLGTALFLTARRYRQWRALHRVARRARRLSCEYGIPVFSSDANIEPGVFGVFHPVLLLPEGLADALTVPQFDTIIAHELNHARYRDNMTAAVHMCVETVFWFHPLAWWIGGKLMDERERDCDEAVLAQGGSPGDYARGILQICRRCAESPLPCAAGIGGSDLKKRIREIMTWRGSLRVTSRGRVALVTAAAIAVSVPFVIGIVRGQSLPPAPAYKYSVVSIHRSASASDGWGWQEGPQRGLRVNNATTIELLLLAYQIPEYRLTGAPKWASSDRYDVTLTPAEPEAAEATTANPAELARRERNWQRLQAVLRDRFKLVLRLETHELPVYALVADEKGVTLSRSDGKPSSFLGPVRAGQVNATSQPIGRLTQFLSEELRRPVIDETKLDGQYDFKLRWDPTDSVSTATPDATSNPLAGLSMITALREQLGLRLVAKKGPVQVFVIEEIERPSEN